MRYVFSAIALSVMAAGCQPSTTRGDRVDNANHEGKWAQFVKLVGASREMSKKGLHTRQALAVQRQLGIKKHAIMPLTGFFGVAAEGQEAIGVFPFPEPGSGSEDSLLACAGDVLGDAADEYVLSAGFIGPTRGVVLLYDDNFKKLVEHDPGGCVVGLEVRDLTGDGKAEIVVWVDSHPGVGMSYRYVKVLQAESAGSLKEVFSQTSYSVNNRPAPVRKEIWVGKVYGRSKPAVITVRSYKKGMEVEEKFIWDTKLRHFKKQGK
jgi:hypothetical protein